MGVSSSFAAASTLLVNGKMTEYAAVVQEAEARKRIQKLLVTGDNRLKQGVDPAKARESYEQALAAAEAAGLADSVRPLVEVRLADLERLRERSAEPRSSAGRAARSDARTQERQ